MKPWMSIRESRKEILDTDFLHFKKEDVGMTVGRRINRG